MAVSPQILGLGDGNGIGGRDESEGEDHANGSALVVDRFLQASTACDLCSGKQQWLFVLAPEQSLSRPTMEILTAIPGYTLKRQQGGSVVERLQQLYQAARQINERNLASDPAWKSNPISESRMLCSMQDFARELSVGQFNQDLTSVIGFDESWNASNPERLKFLYKLFPCGRFLVIPGIGPQTSAALIAQSRNDVNGTASTTLLASPLASQHEFIDSHSRSFHVLQGDLSATKANGVLDWLGVSGCHFQAIPEKSADEQWLEDTMATFTVSKDPAGGVLRLGAGSRARVYGQCHTPRWTAE